MTDMKEKKKEKKEGGQGTSGLSVQKRRQFRLGTVALKEICKFQKSTWLPYHEVAICEVGEGDCPSGVN